MNSKRGFTLIELLIALCLFSIVATSLTALLTSGLRARQKSQRILNAQQVAYAVIEDHKNFWSIKNNYAVKVPAPSPAQTLLPQWNLAGYLQNVGVEAASVSVFYGCLDTDGTDRSASLTPSITPITTQVQALNCTVNEPDLRRITVTVRDAQGQVTANLSSEIGKPVAAR